MKPWAVTPEKIAAVVERIVTLAQARRVILFGSAIRDSDAPPRDLDILVVARDESRSPRKESVRIRRALRGVSMPMDVLVISERKLEQLADQPGLIYREALRHGRVVYQDTK